MGFFSKLFGIDERNRKLLEWGQGVALTQTQRAVMRELMICGKAGTPPRIDPLGRLSAEDRKYLTTICGADFRPPEFGNADTMRLYLFKMFKEKGFTAEQSAIILGMTVNAVGPQSE